MIVRVRVDVQAELGFGVFAFVFLGRVALHGLEELCVVPCLEMRIPIESDHLFRSNPITCSGVSDHPEGRPARAAGMR
jgi:hypothetical protein